MTVARGSTHDGVIYTLLATATLGVSMPFAKGLGGIVSSVAPAGMLYLDSKLGNIDVDHDFWRCASGRSGQSAGLARDNALSCGKDARSRYHRVERQKITVQKRALLLLLHELWEP